MKKKVESFEEQKAEQLVKEICGDFNCKLENWKEDKAHKAPACLLKEDRVFAKAEFEVLKLAEKKLKKFLEKNKKLFEN